MQSTVEKSLVQPLFEGPLDTVADVHGEIDALRNLMGHLGYNSDGIHPKGRRLVFLGDLTDRGPDSPGVVAFVARCVQKGLAQCILGNHELNILLRRERQGNAWFSGQPEELRDDGPIIPQKLADEATATAIREFFAGLPLALERSDLRIVHACWNAEMIGVAQRATDVVRLHKDHEAVILAELERNGTTDEVQTNLDLQNKNPVKVLTSGPETRAETPFEAGGRLRWEKRVPWWNNYRDEPFCVVGHYSHLLGEQDADGLFSVATNATLGPNKNVACIDFGMAKRWEMRLDHKSDKTKLAALRFPERVIVCDDGHQMNVE